MMHRPLLTLQLLRIIFAALRRQTAAQHCSQAHSHVVTFTVLHPAGRLSGSVLVLLPAHNTEHHTEINLEMFMGKRFLNE